METIVVIIAVSLAAFFTIRSLYRTFSTRQEEGGCGCASGKSGCSVGAGPSACETSTREVGTHNAAHGGRSCHERR